MGSLAEAIQWVLSKEISHEPTKEIDTRYSKWLEEHKSSLSKEGYDGYNHQYELIKELNQVYDRDSGNITRIVELVLEMQECGQPPSDIVQELAPDLVDSNFGQFEGYHVYLPTEVLCNILLRLPSFKLVCQFRCVSKLWNSLLSEASFINKISSILISKIPWILMYDPSDIQVQLCHKQDTHKFVNRRDRRLSFDFLLDTYPFNGQELEKVCILDSCSNGLVLYSPFALVYERAIAEEDRNINMFLCICNPLTKQWIALPPRPVNGSEKVFNYCTKLVCESETLCQDTTCNYKVVHVYADTLGDNLCFQVFSSDTGEWKIFSSPRNLWKHIELWRFSDMVIRHGVLYWTGQVRGPDGLGEVLIGYSILDNNENAENRYMSMDLPMKTDHVYEDGNRVSFFGESEGGSIFYYGQIEDSEFDYYRAFLSVYRIDQDDHTNGGFNCETVHNNMELKGYRASEIEAVYINPVNPNVIIIVQWGCCLQYNITTLTHEVLDGHPIPPISEFRMSLPPILIRPKSTVIPPLLN